MIESHNHHHRSILRSIARNVMIERGLWPDFSPETLVELDKMREPAFAKDNLTCDLRSLVWCSIDNDDSRDLDQLTVATPASGGSAKILVAVADVDALVSLHTAIDEHAQHNTTSVYTAAEVFPMLPEKLSTDLTSLNLDSDRLSVVVEMIVSPDGSLDKSDVYRAWVRNHAKLTYNSVAEWLEGDGQAPASVSSVAGLEVSLRLQDATAQKMKELRHRHGALNLETIQARPVFDGDQIRDMEPDERNRAKDIIEDFMIAVNGVVARFLASKQFPSLRRVVRTPKRWDRIVEIAAEYGAKLPVEPDSVALDRFLISRKAADPISFPDLSLTVIKLLGAGEYMAEAGDGKSPGHFGLAMRDYSHSTAPNRRYPDLISQRLVKAALVGGKIPYTILELETLAKHCTEAENAAKKVERQVSKSAAAMLLESRIGERCEAIVTGAAAKGTWVRLIRPPIEGRLISGFENLDVGHRLRVELVHTDVERGFIDFKRV